MIYFVVVVYLLHYSSDLIDKPSLSLDSDLALQTMFLLFSRSHCYRH